MNSVWKLEAKDVPEQRQANVESLLCEISHRLYSKEGNTYTAYFEREQQAKETQECLEILRIATRIFWVAYADIESIPSATSLREVKHAAHTCGLDVFQGDTSIILSEPDTIGPDTLWKYGRTYTEYAQAVDFMLERYPECFR